MIAWIQKALKQLSPDELQRVLSKVQQQYKQACKIVAVQRSETKTQVLVQLTSGEQKLVVL
jgi:hypothetical protein